MIINNQSRKIKWISIFAVIFIIFAICLPGALKYGNSKSNSVFNPNDSIRDSNNTNYFSKENYSEILSTEKHGLGNITITDLIFNRLELGICSNNDTYPLLAKDFNSTAINMTIEGFKFIKVVTPARNDNLDDSFPNKNNITVLLNESLYFKYNNSKTGYLIYLSRLAKTRLIDFYIQNGTNKVKLEEKTDYHFDKHNFIVFHYKDFFREDPTFNFSGKIFNFSMYLIWEWDIFIENWDLVQTNDLMVGKALENYSVDYTYSFNLVGKKHNQSNLAPFIDTDNLYGALRIDLFDKELLNDHILELNNEIVDINTHLNPNKTINVLPSDFFLLNSSSFRLNFTTIFTLRFVDPVGRFWSIDRLVAKRDVRERIYFPSLIAGPKHFYLKSLTFYEPSILFENMISAYPLFEREMDYYYINTSIPGETKLMVNMPFLIFGETCPFSLKYNTSTTLKIIITDTIRMPLIGAKVELFYNGVEYGTYISNNEDQPIPLGNTNENGEIILNNVIIGNYTVRVYYRNSFIKEASVNTYKASNYVRTNILHFPVWIVVFGALSGTFIAIGMIYYLKNKKLR
ncbi:MAG: hypothetical protein ACFFB0_10875 [Promethearchaeota archaeon]